MAKVKERAFRKAIADTEIYCFGGYNEPVQMRLSRHYANERRQITMDLTATEATELAYVLLRLASEASD
jgi:hypothetical protein